MDVRPPEAGEESPMLAGIGASVGTDWPTYRREGPGVSAFALEDGVVYYTYSAYERGLDVLWGMYQWLDPAPLAPNDTGLSVRRHHQDARPANHRYSIQHPPYALLLPHDPPP